MIGRKSGLRSSPKKIRYYERIDLIPPADRKANGYRNYSDADVHRLRLVRTARDVGFSLQAVRDLLHLCSRRNRRSIECKAAAQAYVAALKRKAADLAVISKMLHVRPTK